MTGNKCFVLGLALLLLLIPRSSLAGGRISLRFYGGMNYLLAGDVNAGTRGFLDWGKSYFAPPPDGSVSGGYASIHLGQEFGGDIIFELNPRLGIGIGAGYLKGSKSPLFMMHIVGDTTNDFSIRTELSAIPIRLNAFLTSPVSGRLSLVANVGASYYLKAKYHAFWVVDEQIGIPEMPFQILTTDARCKGFPLGFQGGLGLEYGLWPRAALFIEAQGYYARLLGFEGTSTWEQGLWGGLFPPFSETGKLYYESVPMIPGSPRLIMVQSAPPAGPGGRPRGAAVDFSGVSIQAGIRIRL